MVETVVDESLFGDMLGLFKTFHESGGHLVVSVVQIAQPLLMLYIVPKSESYSSIILFLYKSLFTYLGAFISKIKY